jgi:lipopolysaccharide transport system ATP-binding protein
MTAMSELPSTSLDVSSAHGAMPGEAVLSVQGLGKEYRLYDSPRERFKALITGKPRHRSHWALRDVSFELGRGQCLGVIGDNGAGKSSLLKLLAGTVLPSTGTLHRNGRVTAILELGAGFHPDFTGRDNLYFAGSLIGIDAARMAELEEEVVAFSELGVAIDRAVKTYSSGMVVRLAFALVTAVEPDVLIVDEALAVGDQHFQKKCVERIEAFRRNGCTILFCSHSLYHVRQLCDRALWMDGGRVRALGSTDSVLAAYDVHVRAQDRRSDDALAAAEIPAVAGGAAAAALAAGEGDGRAAILALTVANLLPADSADPPLLESTDLAVTITVRTMGGEMPNIGIMLEQAHGVGITSEVTHAEGFVPVPSEDGLWRITLTFPALPLHSGEYVVSGYLFDSKGLVVYDEWLHHLNFRHVVPSLSPGLVRLPHIWSQG